MKRSSPGEDFLRQAFFVDHRTKSSLAKEFGCTIPVVNRWLKEAGIQLEPHFGRKLNVDEERFRQDVGTMRMSELKLKYECSHSGIKGLCRRLGVDPPKKTSDDWKEGTELIAKKLDWIKDQNTNHGRTIESLADELNTHVTKILRILRTDGYDVRIHGYSESKGEAEVRDYVRSLGFSADKRRFVDSDGRRYELDVFCDEADLAIEYCGEYYHSVERGTPKDYHLRKLESCLDAGIGLMTIFESEWREKKELIQGMIRSRLGLNDRLFARKCEIVSVDAGTAREFHERNHLSGYVNSSVNIGLEFSGALVSCMSFVRSRFDRSVDWEIARFSTEIGITVIGGASRLLAEFEKRRPNSSIVSYADRRIGEGTVYEKSGFNRIGFTNPGYKYFIDGALINRMMFQKRSISNGPDDARTEAEIMRNKGYLRVYDCGNAKFIRRG